MHCSWLDTEYETAGKTDGKNPAEGMSLLGEGSQNVSAGTERLSNCGCNIEVADRWVGSKELVIRLAEHHQLGTSSLECEAMALNCSAQLRKHFQPVC